MFPQRTLKIQMPQSGVTFLKMTAKINAQFSPTLIVWGHSTCNSPVNWPLPRQEQCPRMKVILILWKITLAPYQRNMNGLDTTILNPCNLCPSRWVCPARVSLSWTLLPTIPSTWVNLAFIILVKLLLEIIIMCQKLRFSRSPIHYWMVSQRGIYRYRT